MRLDYDIIVIGAGHAGCEAAHAAAVRGAQVCFITMDMEKIAQMSCNPAIGGIAKGQIVREIDALGGMTAQITDRTTIQFRMLNLSKGPAMWSPRAQCDRFKFSALWRKTLENTPNLTLWQDQVDELLTENGAVAGVHTVWGHVFKAKCVVLTAGTFLNGLMHIGRSKVPGGRISEPASLNLTESISRHGVTVGRMKTGTPLRINSNSVDFTKLTKQDGDADFHHFSFVADSFDANSADATDAAKRRTLPQLPCWICNTNERAHEIMRNALADSPLYNGQIKSIGPRYCPSIETKLHTFPDKDHHPLFLEPEGLDTNQMYLNGFSSSLPTDVQLEALRTIPGFEKAEIYRSGYAIEYDFFDPTELYHSLESKKIANLYFAGQVNGTTGYEEAAGQGLVAGINASLKCEGKEPFVMKRDESYIGVLIDDLVTKGVDEPYRMFTSRAEFRILLRQDNADARLTPAGHKLGLIGEKRYADFLNKQQAVADIIAFCKEHSAKPGQIDEQLVAVGSTPLSVTTKLNTVISRPNVTLNAIAEAMPALKKLLDSTGERKNEITETAEIAVKYEGYIVREQQEAQKMHRLESIRIRGVFDYSQIKQISTEGRQKLAKTDPETLGQASRIPGVSPSDINVLLVLMHR